MSQVRIIKPRGEPPPKDRPVQWFFSDGVRTIEKATFPGNAIAWCLPATLTEPSGPVHSLEAQELPLTGNKVLIRCQPVMRAGVMADGGWFVGYLSEGGAWIAATPTQLSVVTPDAWRPIDDEPGDAELLEAANLAVSIWRDESFTRSQFLEAMKILETVVQKRGGK